MPIIIPFKKKHRAKTHDECRAALCALCFSSKTVRPVSSKVDTDIKQFVYPEFSLTSSYLPTSICGTCRLKLSDHDKVNDYILN